MAKEFLLEIGTEEIPSRFIPPALQNMKGLFIKILESGRIAFNRDAIRTFGTPRRLILCAQEVEEHQADLSREVIGPPRNVAFDAMGRPTKAAVVFAEKNKVALEALFIKATEKGEYIAARIDEKGGDTASWLAQSLPGFILSIPFPKSMRWMDKDIRFARPIHWILALWGGVVVDFEIDGIKSGNISRGHRFMSPGAFLVKDFKSYMSQTELNYIIADPEERRKRIIKQTEDLAGSVGGVVRYDPELLQEVTNLVEYPIAVMGSFKKEFLRLPMEVVITAMREHQKYFAVTGSDGGLLPYFITISNTRAEDMDVVRAGNERVLTARLSDAAYFFDQDIKVHLADRVWELKKVTYQEKLGTLYDKTERIMALSVYLAGLLKADAKIAERAAFLSKADLLTGIVREFPRLQGVMGMHYAIISGEDKRVADAIYEHYLPRYAGDVMPKTPEGMCVGIADRIDSIVGCFSVGLVPTGSEDPYGLKRQSMAIINMLFEHNARLSLNGLVEKACGGYNLGKNEHRKTVEEVMEFFRQRLSGMLVSDGLRPDAVDAALAVEFDDPLIAREKARALDSLRTSEDYQPLITALKRAGNILPKDFAGTVKKSLLKQEEEKALFAAYMDIKERVETKKRALDFRGALMDIASIRRTVDAFFDKVMVMDGDEDIRNNRLAILLGITRLFGGIADFSRLILSAEEARGQETGSRSRIAGT